MSSNTKHLDVQWAEMHPHMYAGENCDEARAEWLTSSLSDLDEDKLEVLELAARTFPPGTKVTVSEPLCPSCGELREPVFPQPDDTKPLFEGPCRCGFDWDAWARDQYS